MQSRTRNRLWFHVPGRSTVIERIPCTCSLAGVAHFHHRFHRVIHLPAPWLGKKYLIPSQGAEICGTTSPARGAWGMKYLIPSQGRWALVVPHPQPGGRHVHTCEVLFPPLGQLWTTWSLRAKSPTHNFMKKKIRKYKLSFAFIEKLCR